MEEKLDSRKPIKSTQKKISYQDFLIMVLENTLDSQGNLEIIYPFLMANSDKLDTYLVQLLRIWATATFPNLAADSRQKLSRAIFTFSNLLSCLPMGSKANNVEIAIAGYEMALTVLTREEFPEEWATIQNNLGGAYSDRLEGDRYENLKTAIICYKQTLQIYSRENAPELWAAAQGNIGLAYYNLCENERNIEQAIACFELSLQVYTREEFPQDWATAQNNLGLAYHSRIQGNRTENIEQAITCFELALQVYAEIAFPELWATTKNNLGVAYGNRLKGNRDDNLRQAIACYQDSLQIYSRKIFPEKWATVQSNLGVYYSTLEQERAKNLEQAITCFDLALQVHTFQLFPEEWGAIQNCLGNIYLERLEGEKSENFEQAITCFELALQANNPKVFPERWASIQWGLGIAYHHRRQGKRAENLDRAIACLKLALQVYTREDFPEKWASIQNNLALGYVDRIKGERAENLEQAIACLNLALQVYTHDNFPEKWASTQNNLAAGYLDRIKGERSENLEQSITYYKQILQVYTYETFPKEWAIVQGNMGTAYRKKSIEGKCAKDLEKAITCYMNALQLCNREAFHWERAMTQHNLGVAYTNYEQAGRTQNLEQAIAYYIKALQIFTREKFPQDWAMTQHNLGVAYRYLSSICSDDSGGEILKQAVNCYENALQVYTPASFPRECLKAGRDLGYAAFIAGLWSEAIKGYTAAIDAVEQTRAWVTSESCRQEILKESIGIYSNLVQACICSGQLEKAIEYVERSRSKRLVDLMASSNLDKGGEVPPEIKELLQQFDDLQERIDQERSQNKSDNNRELMGVGTSTLDRATFQAYNEAIAALEAEKLQIWEQLRRLDPVLAGEIKVDAPNFVQMQKLIDQPTTAILSFYTTAQALHIFILRQNQITLHTCPNQGIEPLQGWISQNWLQPYAASCHPNRPKPERDYLRAEWISKISPFLTELAQRLQLTDLIAKHLNGIEELIVVPHLLLHQIPFAALPIQDPEYRYLGDKFLIRYTPSCQVLEFCKQRGEVTENFTYGTVEDATNDLPFASFEGEQIAQLHQISSNRRLRGSSQATRHNYRKLAEQIQVLHSCHHAESCLDAPLNSHLKLGDGSITLGQLMSPGWRLPNLSDVFLSCCETGLSWPPLTDDILTLSTGFLCAGARSVVSTLWAVNDLATAIFSIFYYQHRQQGCSRPEAVRQAQIKLRELNKEELLKRKDIKELSRQAEAGRKQARNKRNQYESGSANYLNWDREYRKYASVTNQIHSVKNAQDEEPFSHPRYWAAFTCSGLR